MKITLTLMLTILLASAAQAQGWVDVDRTGIIARGGVYCTSEQHLMSFGEYAQDGDAAGADRMVSEGKCVITQSPIEANVIQENDYLATFISPSGKAFWTFKQLIQ